MNTKSWRPKCCGVAGARFGTAACGAVEAEDALLPSMGQKRQAYRQTALIQLCVPSVPRHPPLQPIHLLHDILYNQDLGKAIKRDFLSGSERMLIDVWNTIILLGSLAFFCSWLLLIKQLYSLGLLCPFTRSFLPRSRQCLKKAVCLCIPNISQGRGKKRGGEVKAKISHPAWYVGPLLNAVFGLEPCIWTPAHASWKGNFYFVCLKGNKSTFKKATWGDFSGAWPDWSGK